ncbi:MAG: endolytic transglycosylase MltG [bacterium]|nr:endolytic transglycosylase MltG [bacterium]
MKKAVHFLAGIFFGGIFVLVQIALFNILIPLNNSQEKTIFHIEKGEGSEKIAMYLEEEGIIRSSAVFRLYVLATGLSRNLKAGDYELSSSMNVASIAGKIVSGDIAKETLTIIEGWSRKDIAQYLQEKGIPHGKDLEGSSYAELEGYLFPDTYTVRKGADLKEVIALMRDTFDTKITQEMKDQALSDGRSFKDIITMASLIEKEVRIIDDKRIASGILWKRLEIGMPLQVDATITYVTGNAKVSVADTKIDSPYNTYQYRGLPAGPIANPGIESIQAALNPEATSYLYYLSTPEGKTVFNRTLQEHNEAKAEHLR